MARPERMPRRGGGWRDTADEKWIFESMRWPKTTATRVRRPLAFGRQTTNLRTD